MNIWNWVKVGLILAMAESGYAEQNVSVSVPLLTIGWGGGSAQSSYIEPVEYLTVDGVPCGIPIRHTGRELNLSQPY